MNCIPHTNPEHKVITLAHGEADAAAIKEFATAHNAVFGEGGSARVILQFSGEPGIRVVRLANLPRCLDRLSRQSGGA